MDHQEAFVLELDRHYLKRRPICIVSKEDESKIRAGWSTNGRILFEAEAAMLDDVARAFMGYPMLGCGTSPREVSRAIDSV